MKCGLCGIYEYEHPVRKSYRTCLEFTPEMSWPELESRLFGSRVTCVSPSTRGDAGIAIMFESGDVLDVGFSGCEGGMALNDVIIED